MSGLVSYAAAATGSAVLSQFTPHGGTPTALGLKSALEIINANDGRKKAMILIRCVLQRGVLFIAASAVH